MTKKAEPNKVTVKMVMQFLVTSEEFRVLMAALRHAGSGVPFKQDMKNLAKELQEKLFNARNASAKTQLTNILKMEDSTHDYEMGPPPSAVLRRHER